MNPAPTQVIEVDLQTRYGRVQGRLAVPPRPMRLAELAFNFLSMDERLINMAVTADTKAGNRISCAKGCSACCNQVVPISPAEAFMLSDMVRSFPPDRKAVILERFARTNRRLEEEGFGERYKSSGTDMESIAGMGVEYQRLNLPCPFLEDQACSIHPNRPTVCREFLATTPASHCVDPSLTEVRSVPLAVSLTECLSKLSAVVMGGEPQVIPMTLALDWAEENRELGRQAYDAGSLMGALVDLMAENLRHDEVAPPGPEGASA